MHSDTNGKKKNQECHKTTRIKNLLKLGMNLEVDRDIDYLSQKTPSSPSYFYIPQDTSNMIKDFPMGPVESKYGTCLDIFAIRASRFE